MIDEKKLLADLIPILKEADCDLYLDGRLIDSIDCQPKVMEWIPVSKELPVECEDLEDLEDLEEQCLLVRLPCKVGDKVYIEGHRFPAEIQEICINKNGVFFEYAEYEYSPELTELWDAGDFAIEDIGKTVFLTQEEAEQALREMGE